MLTRGSCKNDFDHSEAVHQRLSELLPNAHEFGMDGAEVFILIAGAYLHDIGHSNTPDNQRHGAVSANMIINNDSLKCIFPAGDIQNQVARVCDYHDREIEELEDLEKVIRLDIRPCRCFTSRVMRVRLRMLSAILRLADELECNSDRIILESDDDPRTVISGVRIDLARRHICLAFKHGSTEEKQNRCLEHIRPKVEMLSTFLKPYGLSFTMVDELRKEESVAEEKRDATQLGIFQSAEKGPKSLATPQKGANLDDLTDMYEKARMSRIDSVTSLLSERGKRK
jgi:hypothetical protein